MRGDGDDGRDLLRDGSSAARADQAAESGLGRRSFAASVVLHAVLVVLVFVAGFVSFDKKKKNPLDELSEFTVAIPPDGPEAEPEKPEPDPPKPEPEPETEPDPPPAPVRDAIPVPATTKPKPTRPPIDTRNVKIVKRTMPTTTRKIVPLPSTRPPKPVAVHTTPTFSGPRLSSEELRKLLDMGATVSDRTSIPADELHRCYALIRRQLFAAWIRPSAASVSGREPVVSISVGPGGVVRSASLKTGSGDPELDRSAVAAANAVQRFTGLSEDFVRENPSFTVAFKLEE